MPLIISQSFSAMDVVGGFVRACILYMLLCATVDTGQSTVLSVLSHKIAVVDHRYKIDMHEARARDLPTVA